MADETETSPFKRPWFITAAVGVGLLVIVAVVMVVISIADPKEPSAEPSSKPSTSASAAPTETPSVQGGASVCGLDTVKMNGTLNVAPAAEWSHLDTSTFPTSKASGPGKTADDGVLTCFERTPAGAVFFAAASAAQGSDPALAANWLDYVLVDSPAKAGMVDKARTGTAGGSSIRLTVSGFKLLSYDGNNARVDIGLRGDGQGKSIYMSMIYTLRWENGDWRLNVTSASDPGQVAQLPNLAGYALWEE